MDVLVLIDKLDDQIHNAKPVPLTDQVRVDKEEIYDILDQMRATIPEEIKQARWIVKERQEMLAEAKREAERIAFIEEAVADLGLDNVTVEKFDVLVVEFARTVGANAIVKGLRAISDFEYEFEMNQLNRTMAPDIESIFMMSSPQFSFLSSSGVKELAMFGGDLSGLVPDAVAAQLQERLKR